MTHLGTTEAGTALEMTTRTSGRLTNTSTMPDNRGMPEEWAKLLVTCMEEQEYNNRN